jgi:hypothetical protein
MRPIMTSPCSVCGVTLEHDQDPRRVMCGGCEAEVRSAARKSTQPPPTVEYHRVVPPLPPPAREPFNHPRGEEFGMLAFATLCVALGFLCGCVARGGA